MDHRVVVRRMRRGDVEVIAGVMNALGWCAETVSETDAARKLLEKGYLLAISRYGAALLGWQAENLVTCADDFFVYPPQQAANLGVPLLAGMEAAAQALVCEVAIVFVPEKGRQILEPLLQECGYENRDVAELDRIWVEVLTSFTAENRTHVWLKRLREDRVTMPF